MSDIAVLISLNLLVISAGAVLLIRKLDRFLDSIADQKQKLDEKRVAETVEVIPAQPGTIGFRLIPETREIRTVSVIGWRITRENRPFFRDSEIHDYGFNLTEAIFDQTYHACWYVSTASREVIGCYGKRIGDAKAFASGYWSANMFDSPEQLEELVLSWAEENCISL